MIEFKEAFSKVKRTIPALALLISTSFGAPAAPNNPISPDNYSATTTDVSKDFMGLGQFQESHNYFEIRNGDALSKIKDFEKRMGSKAISYSLARSYAPVVIQYFAESGSFKPYDALNKDVYIIGPEPPVDTEEDREKELRIVTNNTFDPFKYQRILEFQTAYPQFQLDHFTAIDMARSSILYGGWYDQTENLFVVQNNTTGREIHHNFADASATSYDWQFQGDHSQVVCQENTPAVVFRSILMHELQHKDVSDPNQPWKNLDELKLALDNTQHGGILTQGDWHDKEILSAKNRNFIVEVGSRKEDNPKVNYHYLTNLEEFVTDYLASRKSINGNLPYILAYGEPVDFANFSAVLKQANISNDDLDNMDRDSMLEEFLLKIAQSSKGVTLGDKTGLYNLATTLFPFSSSPAVSSGQRYFGILHQLFPNTDATTYMYNDPKDLSYKAYGYVKNGCLASNSSF